MKVYWETNGRNKGLSGRRQQINWFFDYAGKRRCIPAVYRFPEGIVFDLLTILDEAELRAFYDKYKDAEEPLLTAKRRAVEDEHPYQGISMAKVNINGKQPSGWSSSGKLHVPWKETSHPTLTDEAKAYARQLRRATCFACERYTIPLNPEPISKWERFYRWLRPEKIRAIGIETGKTIRFLPIVLSFSLPHYFSGLHTEIFTHPQTQVQHTLYFQKMEHEEAQIPAGETEKTLYIAQLSYEISPELPEGNQLQFDNSMTWEPEPIMADGISTAPCAGAIGIIGGSSGSTAIFFAGKRDAEIPCGAHGLPLHTCFAKPSTTKEQIVNVVLEGVNINRLEPRTFSWKS